jgi:long-chain fatty acid transport protein
VREQKIYRLFACACSLVPTIVLAGSVQLSEESVSGLGTAFAGVTASAEDASVLFSNPAGITLLNQGEFQLGLHVIAPTSDFTNEGSRYNLPGTPLNGLRLHGGNGGDAGVVAEVPNLYLTQPVIRGGKYGDLSVGLGINAPFGLQTNYDSGWVGRYAGLRTKLTTFDFQPTVAWRFLDRISLGASIDVQRASARLSQAIDFGLAAQQPLGQFFSALPAVLAMRGVPPAAIPGIVAATEQAYANAGFVPGGRDGISEIHGDDWAAGFTLGALVEYRKARDDGGFFQEGRLGLSYRSPIEHTLEGDADFRKVPLITAPGAPVQFPDPTAFQRIFFAQGASAILQLPDIFHVGVYQRFAQNFALLGDMSWTFWDRLQTIPITFSSGRTPATSLQPEYNTTGLYAVGLEWYACHNVTLRTGFAYDETPIPSETFRTPRIPDNDRYILSAGARWSPTRWMDLDIAYSHFFLKDSRSDFFDGQGHELIGKYAVDANIVSAAVTVRWGGSPDSKEQSEIKNSVSELLSK